MPFKGGFNRNDLLSVHKTAKYLARGLLESLNSKHNKSQCAGEKKNNILAKMYVNIRVKGWMILDHSRLVITATAFVLYTNHSSWLLN